MVKRLRTDNPMSPAAKRTGPPLSPASDGVEDEKSDGRRSELRAQRFRRNFLKLLERKGMSIKRLAQQTGVSLQTLRYWKRSGISYSRDERLEIVARVLGVGDPQALFEENLEPPTRVAPAGWPSDSSKLDLQTNPVVQYVLSDQPELFLGFEPADWDELYSLHGTGGPLTYDGVCEAARQVARKRELRRKFDALLETEHFESLAHLIDVLYRDSSL